MTVIGPDSEQGVARNSGFDRFISFDMGFLLADIDPRFRGDDVIFFIPRDLPNPVSYRNPQFPNVIPSSLTSSPAP